jgi:hypothetical protein
VETQVVRARGSGAVIAGIVGPVLDNYAETLVRLSAAAARP